MNRRVFPKMAAQNIKHGRRIYIPYILAIMGLTAGIYIISALVGDPGMLTMRGAEYVVMMMNLGKGIVSIFSVIFLFYCNSFLMKRRRSELGLYSVLGMGKRHIAVMLAIESLYIVIVGIGGGLVIGLSLYKLILMILFKIMNFPVPFGFTIDFGAMMGTAIFFGIVLAAILVFNLISVWRMSSIEIMQSSSSGEREPKTKWLLTIIGILALGGGYYIAQTVNNAATALALYFGAVLLVIIGTYCLFSAVSITVMKALKKNKKFYYKPNNFISLSGMIYRMKRNAVGLANICILSTIVLVMVSGTISMYLGMEDAMYARYPADLNVHIRFDPRVDGTFEPDKMATTLAKETAAVGMEVDNYSAARYLMLECGYDGKGGFTMGQETGNGLVHVIFIAWDDVAQLLDDYDGVRPQRGEVLYLSPFMDMPTVVSFDFGEGYGFEYTPVKFTKSNIKTEDIYGYTDFPSGNENVYFILPEEEDVLSVYHEQQAAFGEDGWMMRWEGRLNVKGSDAFKAENAMEIESIAYDVMNAEDIGDWYYMRADGREANANDLYVMSGAFLFLGIVLGVIFLMGTVLIIYYKQVSEGYDDRHRFQIMQKVGLSQREVKRSVKQQVLTVFFMPLLVALIHIIFDFKIMTLLLRIFFIYDTSLIVVCTAATFAIFAVAYMCVYLLTTRVYYKIIS